MIDYEQNAFSIFNTINYITLATSSKDGKPWNTPLGFKVDKDLNIFWASEHIKQHSVNIRENDNVFIVIYDSTVPPEKGEAIYIMAHAQELETVEDIKYARRLFKGSDEHALEKLSGNSIHRAYRAAPKTMWINGPKDKSPDTWRDTRFELDMAKLKNLLG